MGRSRDRPFFFFCEEQSKRDQLFLDGVEHKLDGVVDTEFAEDVVLDGDYCQIFDAEFSGNLFILKALAAESDDIQLAWSENAIRGFLGEGDALDEPGDIRAEIFISGCNAADGGEHSVFVAGFWQEAVYAYMTKNADFDESHTGLADVLIETEIMAKCFAQHKKMDKSINRSCWRIPQKKGR